MILQRQRNSATKRSEGNRGQHGTLEGLLRNRLRRRVVPAVGYTRDFTMAVIEATLDVELGMMRR